MFKKKSRGSRTDLCGIPKLTLSGSDEILSNESIASMDKNKMPSVWSSHTTHKMSVFRSMISTHQSCDVMW